MEPSLALTYTSRGRNGHAGLGWQLEGFSAIERCPKAFATEGLADGVHVDAHDAFCLDGHKLVAIQGSYGGDGTEYRTEDDIFAKIVSTAPDREITQFQVWTRAGSIRTYTPVTTPKTTAHDPRNLTWLLHEEADRSGNAVRYSYDVRTKDDFGTPVIEYFPKQIDYTIATQKNPEEPGQRSAVLLYEDRPDPSFAVLGDVRMETTKRLKEIDLHAPSPGTRLPEIAWRYALSYDKSPGSGVSRLTRVERCGALGGCLQAKVFTWESANGPVYASESYGGAGIVEPPVVADLDGDGKDEMVLLWDKKVFVRFTTDPAHPLAVEKQMDGFFDHLLFSEARPVDVDGNGTVEIIAPDDQNHNYKHLWLGNSLLDDPPWLPAFPLVAEPYGARCGVAVERVGRALEYLDVDGVGWCRRCIRRVALGHAIYPSWQANGLAGEPR